MRIKLFIFIILLSVGMSAQTVSVDSTTYSIRPFIDGEMFQVTIHSVTLNWTAPSDSTAASTYNPYKATGICPTSGSPTGLVKLLATPTSVLTYTDTAVQAAQDYCYTVRQVLNGKESPDSNPVTASIPLFSPVLSVTKQ